MKKVLFICTFALLTAAIFASADFAPLQIQEGIAIDSKTMPATLSSGTHSSAFSPLGVMLTEGFETAVPPTGWDTTITSGTMGGTTPCYWHLSTAYQHTGTSAALVGWGYTVDVRLNTMSLDLTSATNCTLSFWWDASYYWFVDPYDNGDLFVEVSTDAGSNWTQLWTLGDSANVVNSGVAWPWTAWVWNQSFLSLDAYVGNNLIVSFHNVHNDGADCAIDDVQIDTVAGVVPPDTFWEVLTDIPAAKSGPLVGWGINGSGHPVIHVFGGNPTAQQTVQYSFDYVTKTWTGPFTMPFPKHYGGCISYENKIYLIGSWSSPTHIMVYDCDGDTFYTNTISLINPVNDAMCALDEGRELIYIVGGGNNGTWTMTNYVQVFDINAMTVAAGTSFPTARMSGAAAYLGNDTLFISSGYESAGYVASSYFGVINSTTPTTITWSAATDCPGGIRYRCGYADLGDALYLFGGYGSTYVSDCWRYRTSDGWVQMPDLFGAGRSNLGGCGTWVDTLYTELEEGLIFAAGGYTPYSPAFGCLHNGCINYIEEEPGEISDVFEANIVSSVFNGEFRIEFNLPATTDVNFMVFDVTGRTITLDNYSNVGAGAHNLVWQGRDMNGKEVSAGTYFFRLEASESVFSGKIIVAE